METRRLGTTDLIVTRLGAGLHEIGAFAEDAEAAAVLRAALDGGVTFLDTAACYHDSEQKIGKAVADRRDSFVLASKCGHEAGEANAGEWTAATITASVEQSLRRLRTDHLDLLQLHSCSLQVLERGEAIDAMERAQQAGKTRYIGYSGDNEAAMWAVRSGRFRTLQTSYNVVEQRARTSGLLQAAQAAGMGVIAKRPIANGSFGAEASPRAYADTYFGRGRRLLEHGALPDGPADRIELSLAFTLDRPEIDTAIVGTRNPAHMRANIALVGRGLSLSRELTAELHRRFELMDQDWFQQT